MPPFPELKDITPPTAPPFSSPEEVEALIWQIFGGVTVLALLAALWLWWRWRLRRSRMPVLPKPPLDHLRDQLAALQSRNPNPPPTEVAHEVADAVRSYLQREHGLMARYRTTEELFGTGRGPGRVDAPPPLPFLRPFADVFARCDSLKFAGAGAAGPLASELIDRALAATEAARTALASLPAPVIPPPLPPPPTPGAPETGASSPSTPPPLPTLPANPPALPPALPRSEVPGAAKAAADTTSVASAGEADALTSAPPPIQPAPGIVPEVSLIPAAPIHPASRALTHRSDAFTHPPSAAFARGADVIPV